VVEFRARREFGETDIVAVTDAGEIASHAAVVLDPTTGVGELEHVATRGAHLRPGLARSVSLAGLHHMRDAGMRHAVVRTHADSGSAISLYESVGFRVMDRLFRYVKDV
jgi:mycothiol synthase